MNPVRVRVIDDFLGPFTFAPVEVWTSIFHHVLPDPMLDSRIHASARFDLCSVCRWFRTLIRCDPSFWCRLNIDTRVSVRGLRLSVSRLPRSVGIHLRFTLHLLENEYSLPTAFIYARIDALLAVVTPTSDRWESFVLRTSHPAIFRHIHSVCVNIPAPSMRRISIEYEDDISEHFDPTSHPVENFHLKPHRWFLGTVGALQHIGSVSTAMDWRNMVVRSNLVSLTLCARIRNLDWALFETLFAESPNLTTLRLREIPDFIIPAAGSLTSPSMVSLFLEFPISILPGHMRLFTQRLSMPHLDNLVLRCESWDDPGFLHDCPGLLTSVRSLTIQGAWIDHAAMTTILPLLLMVSDLDLADSPGAFHALRDWSSHASEGWAPVFSPYHARLSNSNLSPLSSLVLELITTIFVTVCGDYFEGRSAFITARGNLMLVCSRWREMVAGHGAFWSCYVVAPLKTRSGFDLWTSRFRGHHLILRIELDWRGLSTAAAPDQLSVPDMLARLALILPQCADLTIQAPDAPAVAFLAGVFSNASMPDLRSITMSKDRLNSLDFFPTATQPRPVYTPPLPLAVFPTGIAPTFMRLSGLVFAWSYYPCYANVTTFILHSLSGDTAPTVDQLRSVLVAAPLVVRLSVDRVDCADSGAHIPALSMMCLQELHLCISGNRPLVRLLSTLIAPSLSSLHVFVDGPVDLAALVECHGILSRVTFLRLDGERARHPLVRAFFDSMPLVTHCDMAMDSYDFFRFLTEGEPLFPLLRVLAASEVEFLDLRKFLNLRGPGIVLDNLRLRYIHDCRMDDVEMEWVGGKVLCTEVDPEWDTFWYHCQ
ncbi:hypothetical protein DFH06DRAFT_1343349 [Mycena polygramma]|nr:hypothetical protein DFH06DRAFT_1343349 [Mycena polygramma]